MKKLRWITFLLVIVDFMLTWPFFCLGVAWQSIVSSFNYGRSRYNQWVLGTSGE